MCVPQRWQCGTGTRLRRPAADVRTATVGGRDGCRKPRHAHGGDSYALSVPNTSASNAKILVIGHTDLGRRVCLLLRERQVPVIHLAAASEAELREALTAGVTGVAVLLHDDIRALR